MAALLTEWWGQPDQLAEQCDWYLQHHPGSYRTVTVAPQDTAILWYYKDDVLHSAVHYHDGHYPYIACITSGKMKHYQQLTELPNVAVACVVLPDVSNREVMTRLRTVAQSGIVRNCPLPSRYHATRNNSHHFSRYVTSGVVTDDDCDDGVCVGALLGYMAVRLLGGWLK